MAGKKIGTVEAAVSTVAKGAGKARVRSKRHRVTIDGPDPVDQVVGKRVRTRRTLLGMSQEKLGEAIGLTFQQVQKYERGMNRISASKLWAMSNVLEVPVTYFFETILDADEGAVDECATISGAQSIDVLNRRETLELVRAYSRVAPESAAGLLALAKAFAGEGGGEDSATGAGF